MSYGRPSSQSEMAEVHSGVRGMKETLSQAEEGVKLLAQKDKENEVEVDLVAAKACKEELEKQMAVLEAEAAALTGKENKKARTDKEKARSALKNQHDYIDACKIVKGLKSVHGNFEKKLGVTPVETKEEECVEKKDSEKKKDDKKKPKKEIESAGISRAERDELEGLKQKIMDKKAALKEEGMTGGQINKHEEIVALVARMNELKEKECPGSTAAGGKDGKKADEKKKKKLDSRAQAQLDAKQKEFDDYVRTLRDEYKYSKKEIASDPDYQALKAEVDKLSK